MLLCGHADLAEKIIERFNTYKDDCLDTIYFILPNPKLWPTEVHLGVIEKILKDDHVTKFELEEIRERFIPANLPDDIRNRYLEAIDYRKTL